MSFSIAVLFGCFAGLGWGLGPIASKRAFQGGVSPVVAALVQTGIAVCGLWLLTFGLHSGQVLSQFSLLGVGLFIITGVMGSAVGRLLLYKGIDFVGPSINSSIAATDPLFAVFIAFLTLGEVPTLLQLLGCVFTVTGVVFVALSDGGDIGGWRVRLLGIPLSAAMLYGVAAVIRRFGFVETLVSPVFAAAINETTAFIVLSIFFIASQSDFDDIVSLASYRYLVLTGVLYAGGSLSLFVSLNAGPVVIGSTLGSTAAVVSVIGSRLWLDTEVITRKLVIGSAVTVIGVSSIYIG